MAIQSTNNFIYNYGTYTTPYFRIVTHMPVNGAQTPVDCFMYHSQEAYASGSSSITCFPFYVNNTSASLNNSGDNVVNKYLLFVTQQITGSLAAMSTGSTFQITEIPTV